MKPAAERVPDPSAVERAQLRLIPRGGVPLPPPDRGPLLTATEISRQCFQGKVTARWVREHVPGKLDVGHVLKLWYRDDVMEWIASRNPR